MIPGAQWFPWLAQIDLGQGNFQPGPGPYLFDSAGLPHAVLICYESAFSGLCREQILRGARFLVIITNDSWYGRTPGPFQHAAMASLRAVEFRVGVARAANGGISLRTDRTGRRHDETRLFTRTMITGDVPLGSTPTFYTRHGYWLVWLTDFPAALALAVAWWPRRRR
jgi:apolipoprotein N-acyltransferase